MALRPCLELGCPELVRSGRCRRHQRARDAAKNAQPHRWVYADPRWERARDEAIRAAGGRCQAVDAGARCPATVGLHGHHDHPGGVRALLRAGLDPFERRRIVVLCGPHHARVEAAIRSFRR